MDPCATGLAFSSGDRMFGAANPGLFGFAFGTGVSGDAAEIRVPARTAVNVIFPTGTCIYALLLVMVSLKTAQRYWLQYDAAGSSRKASSHLSCSSQGGIRFFL